MRHRQPLFSRAADALQVLVGDESRHVESAPSDSAIVERLDALDASLAEVLDGVKPVRRPFPFGVVVGAVVAVALVVGGSVLVLRANTDRNRAARSVDFAVAEVSFFETAAAADAAWIDKRAEALRDQTQLMATMLAYKESLEPDEQERAAGLIELVSGGEEGPTDSDREARDLNVKMAREAREGEVEARNRLDRAIYDQERSQYTAAVMLGVGGALLGSMISEAYAYVASRRRSKSAKSQR